MNGLISSTSFVDEASLTRGIAISAISVSFSISFHHLNLFIHAGIAPEHVHEAPTAVNGCG